MSGSLGALSSHELPRCPPWLLGLSALLPLAYYVACASAHGYVHEEAALVGAAAELGVSHAPGAPLSSLLSSLLTLLPVGPLAFRVACASAVFAALTLALFARSVFHTLIGLGLRGVTTLALLSLAAAWTVGQCPGFFLGAVRPNVFALQFLIAAIVLDAVLRFELAEPSDDLRPLLFAAFVQGLGFANHHALAWLTLPAVAPTLGRVVARRGFRGLGGLVVALLLGLSAYVYVPLRAAQDPTVNFGDASTLMNLLRMVGADPWWGPEDAPPLWLPGALRDALSAGGPGSAWLLAALACVALWFAHDAKGPRRFLVLWGILLVATFAVLALSTQPTLTADAFGALVPCQLALVALASAGLGFLLQASRVQRTPRLHGCIAGALCALALMGFVSGSDARGLGRFAATDAVADLSYRALPQGAVLLTYDAGTAFRHLGASVEEHVRPDVTLVPLRWALEPWLVDALSMSHPELKPLLRELLVRGQLELSSLQSLAAERPVVLELDPRMPPELYPTLLSEGLFSRVLPDATTQGDERVAAAVALPRLERLHRRLAQQRLVPELRAWLASRHLYQALQAASLGDKATAQVMVSLALGYAPEHEGARRLRATLLGAGPGRVDPRAAGESPETRKTLKF